MNTLKEHLQQYIVHQYESLNKKEKIIEVALYSINPEDIKFRIIKFVNGAFKEIHTTEKNDEALELFKKLLK